MIPFNFAMSSIIIEHDTLPDQMVDLIQRYPDAKKITKGCFFSPDEDYIHIITCEPRNDLIELLKACSDCVYLLN
jgi:hypothetical protein